MQNGEISNFSIKINLYQGSTLIFYLFNLNFGCTYKIHSRTKTEMHVFFVNIILCEESKEDLNKTLEN